jgi:hypothetical protein
LGPTDPSSPSRFSLGRRPEFSSERVLALF